MRGLSVWIALASRTALRVVTWNVENLDGQDPSSGRLQRRDARSSREQEQYDQHERHVRAHLNKMRNQDVDLIFLQEVASCSLVPLIGFGCIESPISPESERMLNIVWGNVVLYRLSHWSATDENTFGGLKHEWKKVTNASDYSLQDVHITGCTWGALRKDRGDDVGCNLYGDMPAANSARLVPAERAYTPSLQRLLAKGVRAVNVHLYSGVRAPIPEPAKLDRRKFQLRSVFAALKSWREREDEIGLVAGDFNSCLREDYTMMADQAREYDLAGVLDASFGAPASLVAPSRSCPGYLDQVLAVGLPEGWKVTAKTTLLKQPRRGAAMSDHEPVLVALHAQEPRLDVGPGAFPGLGQSEGPKPTTARPSAWSVPLSALTAGQKVRQGGGDTARPSAWAKPLQVRQQEQPQVDRVSAWTSASGVSVVSGQPTKTKAVNAWQRAGTAVTQTKPAWGNAGASAKVRRVETGDKDDEFPAL